MSTKEKYLIGVDRLDAQHRALFSAISRLKTILLEEDFERNKRICKELVRFLEDHVTRHFSDEEAYMREIHYAHYERHKEQHEAIVQMVASMKEEMEASDYSPQSIKHLVGTLLPMLIYHTESVDRFIGKEDPQCDTANDAAQAMSKTMISVVNELFGQSVDLSLETPDFGALPGGDKSYTLVDCKTPQGRKFRIMTAVDAAAAVWAMNNLFSAQLDVEDELVRSALKELNRLIAIHFVRNYQNGVFAQVEKPVELTRETFFQLQPTHDPLCSLLFEDVYGTYAVSVWEL